MSIGSTKKIIATIIVVIMMLGVTTPTFAATTNNMKFDWGAAIGGIVKGATSLAGKAAEVAVPTIGNFSNAAGKIGISSITGGDISSIVNLGKNVAFSLIDIGTTLFGNKSQQQPVLNKNKETNKTNVFDNTLTAIGKVKDIVTTEREEKDMVIELTVLGKNLDDIKDRIVGMVKKDEEEIEENKTTGITNLFKNMFNKEYVEETVEEIQDKLNINTQKTESVLSKFKTLFKKEETVKEEAIKTETQELFGNIQANGLFVGLSAYIQNKTEQKEVGVQEQKNTSTNFFGTLGVKFANLFGIDTTKKEIEEKVVNQYQGYENNEDYVKNRATEGLNLNVLKKVDDSELNSNTVIEYEKDGVKYKGYYEGTPENNNTKFYVSRIDEKGNVVVDTINGKDIKNTYHYEEREGFILPVSKTPIDTSRYNEIGEYGRYPISGGHHDGVDFNTNTGDDIYASESGKVVRAEDMGDGLGKYIIIEHEMDDGEKLYSVYGHNDSLKVEVGQEVKKGEVIATSGNTGNSTGDHLHFEIRETIDGPGIDPGPLMEEEYKQ